MCRTDFKNMYGQTRRFKLHLALIAPITMSKLTVVCCSSQNYPRLYSLYISVQEQFIDYTPFDENKKTLFILETNDKFMLYLSC